MYESFALAWLFTPLRDSCIAFAKDKEFSLQAALQNNSEPVERVSFLKPGFSSFTNALCDSGLFAKLKPAELLVLLTVLRFTSGYQRTSCVIGEAKLCQYTALSPSTVYQAKKDLAARGVLLISYTATGRCCYQLADWLQPVRAAHEAAHVPDTGFRPVVISNSNPSGGSEPYPSGKPDPYKDNKENIDHHQQAAVAACVATRPPRTQRQPDQSLEMGGCDDASLLSQSSSRGSAEALVPRSLARALQELGVNSFMATRLARTQPPEKIEAALQRVASKKPENPAAYLVAELQRGGYGEVPADKTRLIRQAHEALHQKRQVERQREVLEQELAHAKTREALAAFEALPAAEQVQLHALVAEQARTEGFSRIPGWGPSHPVYRGLLAELVDRRYLQRAVAASAYTNGHYVARE